MSTTTGNLIPGYETVIITRIDLPEESLKALKDKIAGIITAFNGESVYQEDWGKRKLAYPIENEVRAQYSYIVYTGKSGIVAEIERNLRLSEAVIRFMTINLAQEFDKDLFFKELGSGTSLKREDRGHSEITPVGAAPHATTTAQPTTTHHTAG